MIPFQAGAIPTNAPGAMYAPGVVGPDLLSALIAFLRSSVELRQWLGTPFGAGPFGRLGFDEMRVYDERAPQGADYPMLVLSDYDEAGPGLTYEDYPIRVTVNVCSHSLDEARRFGAAVKRLLDPPNLNPQAIPRPRLAWARGIESYNTRNDSRPQFAGIGRGGEYVYIEEIDYTFIAGPHQ